MTKLSTSYITPVWPIPKNIGACVTTRHGGFSSEPFDSFNLGTHVNDDNAVVLQNRQKLVQDLQLPAEPFWLNQIHSTRVVTLSDELPKVPDADASISRNSQFICAILTADCLPILLCNKAGDEIAAIHCGWRGLLGGIIDNTVAAMQSDPKSLLAWLGPAIGPTVFELGNEIQVDFIKQNPENSRAFTPLNDRCLGNIYQLAMINLQKLGVTQIFGGDDCTISNPNFYSYRRDKGTTGRQASLIWFHNHNEV